jgi:hypothetical protein
MLRFLDLTLAGLTSGAVYAAIALALVLIWRSTHVVNFAQGGMLMITTFIAFTVIDHGGSYWLALAVAVLSGFVLGGVVERVVIRPVEKRPPLDAVVVTFGLLVLLEGLAGMIFGGTPRSYPPAFSIIGFRAGDHRLLFAPNDLWVVLVVCGVMVLLAVVFRWTSIGLRMRGGRRAGRRPHRAGDVRQPDGVRRLAGVRLHRRSHRRPGQPARRADRRGRPGPGPELRVRLHRLGRRGARRPGRADRRADGAPARPVRFTRGTAGMTAGRRA